MRTVRQDELASVLGVETVETDVAVIAKQRDTDGAKLTEIRRGQDAAHDEEIRPKLDPFYHVELWNYQRQQRIETLAAVASYEPKSGLGSTVLTDGFTSVLEDRRLAPPDSFIAVPNEKIGWYESDGYGEHGIDVDELLSSGWRKVDGLRYCRTMPRCGYQLVLPYHGRPLVPPPGIWEYDLPVKVRSGKFVPDNRWVSIFDLMKPLLAGPVHLITEYDEASWLRLDFPGQDRKHWRCHASVAGINALIEHRYGNGDRYYANWLGSDTIVIRVPKNEAGLWIGVGGNRIKKLSSSLGCQRIRMVEI